LRHEAEKFEKGKKVMKIEDRKRRGRARREIKKAIDSD